MIIIVIVLMALKLDTVNCLVKKYPKNTTFWRLALPAATAVWEGGENLLTWTHYIRLIFSYFHAIETCLRS